MLLLPYTPETENILNAQTLAQMPRGAVIINPGRGPLIDDDALLDALNSGQIGHATLDVFRVEPLPARSPLLGASECHGHTAYRLGNPRGNGGARSSPRISAGARRGSLSCTL